MDLLLRGRGADVGVRAPSWLVRLCGAALALAIYIVADTLELWDVVGTSSWTTRLLVMLLGAVLATTRVGALLWLALGALIALLCVVVYTPIVRPAAMSFVRADAEAPVDAIIVLSGRVNDEGRLSGQSLDRLLTGLAEAQRRQLPAIGLSVVTHQAGDRTVSSEADQRALASLMVPQANVRFVHDVYSTRDEALAFAALARTHGWQRVLAVTSPLHTRRTCAALEAAGLRVQCMPAAARDYVVSRLDRSDNRRRAFADVVYESAATLLYRSRGWLSEPH